MGFHKSQKRLDVLVRKHGQAIGLDIWREEMEGEDDRKKAGRGRLSQYLDIIKRLAGLGRL